MVKNNIEPIISRCFDLLIFIFVLLFLPPPSYVFLSFSAKYIAANVPGFFEIPRLTPLVAPARYLPQAKRGFASAA
jgi:hypothetical protein